MSAEDRTRAHGVLRRAEALVATRGPGRGRGLRSRRAPGVGRASGGHRDRRAAGGAQFEAASEAVREAIAERSTRAAAERERASRRSSASRPIAWRSCVEIEQLAGAERRRSDRRTEGAVGRPAADAVRVRGVADAAVPGCLPRRSRIASGGACWPRRRSARLETLATELEQLAASEQPRRGGRRALARPAPRRRRAARARRRPTRWRPSGSSGPLPRSRRKSRSTSRPAPGRSRTTCAGCSSSAARSRRWPPPSS